MTKERFIQAGKGLGFLIVAALGAIGAYEGKASEALDKLQVAYDEQSKNVAELQRGLEGLAKVQKSVVTECKQITDTLRENQIHFLMGLQAKGRGGNGLALNRAIEELAKRVSPPKRQTLRPLKMKRPAPFRQMIQSKGL